jgi:hypothetical protein
MKEKLLAEAYQSLTGSGIEVIDPFIPGGKEATGGGINLLVNQAFTFFLVAAIVLSIVMIIYGGFRYVTSLDSGSAKDAAKKRIRGAVWGLLIVFSAYLILNTINPRILNFNTEFPTIKTPEKIEPIIINGIDISTYRDLNRDPVTEQQARSYLGLDNQSLNVRYAQGPGRVIGGGTSHLDTDGSPGTYQVVPQVGGPFTINGKTYASVGNTNLKNARSNSGRWVGVQTDNNGQPILIETGVYSDGNKLYTIPGQLSWGTGRINGDEQPFVALSSGQLLAARSISSNFALGDTVLLTANGVTIEAIYADNAGARPNNYSEFSPAAARALGLQYNVGRNANSVSGNVVISLPNIYTDPGSFLYR